MSVSAVLPLWQDRDPLEALETAAIAEQLGYRALWIGEMFGAAGFAELVEMAGTRRPAEVATGIPSELFGAVGLVGSEREMRERAEQYRLAGVDELAIVPVTAGDAGGRRPLEAAASLSPAPEPA